MEQTGNAENTDTQVHQPGAARRKYVYIRTLRMQHLGDFVTILCSKLI